MGITAISGSSGTGSSAAAPLQLYCTEEVVDGVTTGIRCQPGYVISAFDEFELDVFPGSGPSPFGRFVADPGHFIWTTVKDTGGVAPIPAGGVVAPLAGGGADTHLYLRLDIYFWAKLSVAQITTTGGGNVEYDELNGIDGEYYQLLASIDGETGDFSRRWPGGPVDFYGISYIIPF